MLTDAGVEDSMFGMLGSHAWTGQAKGKGRRSGQRESKHESRSRGEVREVGT